MQYFSLEQIVTSARSALKPALLLTMGGTLAIAVFINGLFGMGGEISGAGSLLLRFIGATLTLLWVLFGLTALAHQLHMAMQGEDDDIPDTRQAIVFSWTRIRALLLLPMWAAGGLLVLLLGEMLLLVLGKIPGIGLLWLALIGVPLLLLNTFIAVSLLLALFNIAARVAVSDDDAAGLRDSLWRLLRHRLPELMIYNLGGVVATLLIAAVVLSPIWLGAQASWALVHVVVGDQVQLITAGIGFWGGLAHLLGLIVFAVLLAVVASVPGIVITHMTLLVQLHMDASEAEACETAEAEVVADEESEKAEKTKNTTAKKHNKTSDDKVSDAPA
ncbi:MAG: hypothetical protein R8K53_01440 [Mariprofundaceae bacterium]